MTMTAEEYGYWEADCQVEEQALRRLDVIVELKDAGDRERTAEERAVVLYYGQNDMGLPWAVRTTGPTGGTMTTVVYARDANEAEASVAWEMFTDKASLVEVWPVR